MGVGKGEVSAGSRMGIPDGNGIFNAEGAEAGRRAQQGVGEVEESVYMDEQDIQELGVSPNPPMDTE